MTDLPRGTVARIYDTTTPNDITWALAQLTLSNVHYTRAKLYRDYYDGIHDNPFDTTEYSVEFARFLSQNSVANICPAVVDAITDRLRIVGIKGVGTGNEAAAQQAWDLWQTRRLARVENRVHTESVKAADAYVLVWPDKDGRAQPYPHTALEICHEHDHEQPDIITKAAKLWREGKRWRLTLYYPDRLEKYQTTADNVGTLTAASFERYNVDGEAWPLDNPYDKVPVFHFPFNSDTHRHGRSILKDVISIQNRINHTLFNRTVNIDFVGMPMRILIGMEADTNEDGTPAAPIRAGVDRLITIANPDAKIAEFSAAGLAPFHESLSTDLNMVTVVTGIPPHHFQVGSGDFPSGEALKTSEGRLVSRVQDTQIDFGADWSQVITFMLLIEGVDGAEVEPMWADAQTRNEAAEVEIAAVKVERLGMAKQFVWANDLELSKKDVATNVELKESERSIEATSGSTFDAGRVE